MASNDKRGWRLFSDLNNAFRRDPEINEFDFIPVLEPKNNRSPVVLVDHKLGLELWSVKILFQYVYHTLMGWRNKKSYKFIDPQEIAMLARAVVLVNPECYTAWNVRKELIESGDILELDDLRLSALVLTKHPKSSETFVHRRWVLGRFIENHLQSSQGSTKSTGSCVDGFISMEAIDLNLEASQNQLSLQNGDGSLNVSAVSDYHRQMKVEIDVCRCAAEKYPCNYYAWSQRIWLIQHCYNCSTQVLLSELQVTESWVERHISDTCGFHYRQFLLTTLFAQRDQLRDQFSMQYVAIMQKEHKFVQDLISTYPGHEAMWNHRKYVFHSLHNLYCTECRRDEGENESNLKKTRLENDHHILEQKEIDCVQQNELKCKDIHQKRFAQNYIDWIQKTVIK
ncbi:protein prenyltransferase alpha subunit repeat-containing protein 1-like [Ruditapes philippinarum]|uniref:protein prenyltransferase alpha subunit repeat-containing protein 1-like n=1 Tax=Ruditapes philippinarum TaxID=129788 RepID=UPI00295A62A6|nr:protein prenyltransferase alpha subunit repeat-containing protein 1-like [Ruditapes philippinarum]